MKLEITKKIDNPLMSRTRVLFDVQHDKSEATPSRKQIKDVLVAKLGADRNLLIIRSINSQRGINASSGLAFLYADQKAFDRLALEHLKKRDAREPKSKKAEEAPEKKEKAEEPKEVKEGAKEKKKEEA